MKDARIERMALVAGLVRDHRLSRLRAAIAERDATVALRDGLVALPGTDGVALQAQARYSLWVERRRETLANEILSQTARVEAELAQARTAFARAEVVQALRDQLS